MTGGGFVRRGGFGLGRLIVSRGYGSEGRPAYESVPLACLEGETSQPTTLLGEVGLAQLVGLALTGPLFSGSVLRLPTGTCDVGAQTQLAGVVVAVQAEGLVHSSPSLLGAVLFVLTGGSASNTDTLRGPVSGPRCEGEARPGVVCSGRVLRCVRP